MTPDREAEIRQRLAELPTDRSDLISYSLIHSSTQDITDLLAALTALQQERGSLTHENRVLATQTMRFIEIRQERDTLREALRRIVRAYDGPTVDAATAVSSHIPAARAALSTGARQETPEAPACEQHGVMVADDDMGQTWHCAACGARQETKP